MPDLALQTNESFGTAWKSSIAYGNRFLIDNPIGEESFPGVWSPVKVLPYQLSSSMRGKVCCLSTPTVGQESYKDLISDYKGPFTQIDLIDSEEDQIQELIFQIRTSLLSSCRELANKVFALFNDAKEEDFASVGISLGSLRNFYNFFQFNSNLKCPLISLTPEHNIYASWRDERPRVFSAHFLPNGDVRFVIFKPNDRHPKQQIRLSGTATTDILKETIMPYGVWDWISE